ncbi:protein O-glucosyltransferase 1-like [Gossypium australe]|uniref:Protein O-glucosyltransferase 1-like n=1 Tax=Gossypium australe TaxID=47621 RepID=A0A5B6W238_9ROSI|nr:protein O-glucosyltransferase 1-like [Gossypium australe]
MIERRKPSADFRLVIVNEKAYVEKYNEPYQTRDVFTIWGILQLLRLYPGKVQDLDLLFFYGDDTVIKRRNSKGRYAALAPPVFHYCGEKTALDIVFPDWTFWEWAEVNIKPWEETLKAIKKGRERIGVKKVNKVSSILNWKINVPIGIYMQNPFSSPPYGSMTLLIKPKYYDFFSRSMVPMQHYWPSRRKNKCRDLKFAVEWGNNHPHEAQAIGKAGSKFVEETLTMQNVYDYMFHLLIEYSKLLKFKPTIPSKAHRVCAESVACLQKGLWKDFMVQSMVKSPSHKLPCALPPPYEPQAIQASLDTRYKITRQVETWKTEYWNKTKP